MADNRVITVPTPKTVGPSLTTTSNKTMHESIACIVSTATAFKKKHTWTDSCDGRLVEFNGAT